MLRFLRKHSRSTGTKILYSLLAAVFVVWGVGFIGGRRLRVVARVEGTTITRDDLEAAYQRLVELYQQLYGKRFSSQLARELDLRGRALDQLIEEALIQDDARRLGITVSDREVGEAIARRPEFQVNGRFSRKLLARYLRYTRDRGELVATQRAALLRERLIALVTDGAWVSEREIEEGYHFENDQVKLKFVRVRAADLVAGIEPTEEELKAALAAHPDRYREPEKVRVRYLVYRPADFLAKVKVTQEEIKDEYSRHAEDRYFVPERVRARHILFRLPAGASAEERARVEKKAKEVLARARKGEDFAALARQYSEDPGSASRGGDLGAFRRGQMDPAFEKAAFALKPGEVSDIVETRFGLHIIKAEKHEPAHTRPLAEVREEIEKKLRPEKAEEAARAAAEADRTRLVRGETLEKVAAQSGRKVLETAPFAEGEPVPGLGKEEGFAEAAFALEPGEVSDVVEGKEAFYLLSPAERVPARVPELAAIRDRVLADVRREKARAAAKKKAEAVLARARKVGLEKAAREAGLSVTTTEPFTRKAPEVPGLGSAADLKAEAFALTPDNPLAPRVYRSGDDAVVVALAEQLSADPGKLDQARRDGLRQSLLARKRARLEREYLRYLKQRAFEEGHLEVREAATAG